MANGHSKDEDDPSFYFREAKTWCAAGQRRLSKRPLEPAALNREVRTVLAALQSIAEGLLAAERRAEGLRLEAERAAAGRAR